MMDIKDNILSLSEKANYRVGKTTFIVTAHFSNESESLKTKIENLLTESIRKANCTFACGQDDVIE